MPVGGPRDIRVDVACRVGQILRRRLLLDQVAQAFEPGRTYPEAEVDQILKAVFDDHCALRRYLVDEDFMSRTVDGRYWRAGGTVSQPPV